MNRVNQMTITAMAGGSEGTGSGSLPGRWVRVNRFRVSTGPVGQGEPVQGLYRAGGSGWTSSGSLPGRWVRVNQFRSLAALKSSVFTQPGHADAVRGPGCWGKTLACCRFTFQPRRPKWQLCVEASKHSHADAQHTHTHRYTHTHTH